MKLNKKLTSILVTGAMIASIGGTTAMTSFAADTTPKVTNLTKVFKMPVNTTTPETTFNFDITLSNKDYGSNKLLAENLKLTKTINFGPDDVAAADENGVITITKTTEALFDDEVVWPAAGQYAFKVVERETGTNGDFTYNLENDAYIIYVTVARDADGKLYVKNTVTVNAEDEGKKDATKVDTGIDLVDKDDDGIDDRTPDAGEDSEMPANNTQFINKYVKSTNVTPDGNEELVDTDDDGVPDTPVDPKDDNPDTDANEDTTADDTGLYIQKNVAGDFADADYQFEFPVTVTAPALSDKTQYQAVVIDLDKDTTPIATYTFNSGEEQTVKLADNQRLVFIDLDIGAKYEVKENTPADYTMTNTGNMKGTVRENGDYARVTNTYNDEENTPTGILMQNAPYILVATLAAGGLVIYLAKRREEEEEA